MEWIGKIFKLQFEQPASPAVPTVQRIKRKPAKKAVNPEARERDQIFKRLSQLPHVRKNQIQW